MHAFWLVLTYDLLEDRHSWCHHSNFFSLYFNSLLYKTNRFQVALRLFSNRSQRRSKCGTNKKVAHEAQPSVPLMFLSHFDILCDLLLNRHMATWNLFVRYTYEYCKNWKHVSLQIWFKSKCHPLALSPGWNSVWFWILVHFPFDGQVDSLSGVGMLTPPILFNVR